MRIVAVLSLLLALGACTSGPPKDLKSPCVAASSNQADHPCERRPVNAPWLT